MDLKPGHCVPFDSTACVPFDSTASWTLRDLFAGLAMVGDLAARKGIPGSEVIDSDTILEMHAEDAYRMADAMLEARNALLP